MGWQGRLREEVATAKVVGRGVPTRDIDFGAVWGGQMGSQKEC